MIDRVSAAALRREMPGTGQKPPRLGKKRYQRDSKWGFAAVLGTAMP